MNKRLPSPNGDTAPIGLDGNSTASIRTPLLVAALSLKGGSGKSFTSRLAIDGLIAAGMPVHVVQIDRSPTLPALYPDLTTTIDLPSTEVIRNNPLAAIAAFQPLEDLVAEPVSAPRTIVVDVGGGLHAKSFLNFLGKCRFGDFLEKNGFRFIALVVMTNEAGTMEGAADLSDDLAVTCPMAEIVPVMNFRDGGFKFLPGTRAASVYSDRVKPILKTQVGLKLPAVASGAWPVFESAGLTFLEAVTLDEEILQTRLGLSRLLVTALQGDVAEFLSKVWPDLGAIVGFEVEGANG